MKDATSLAAEIAAGTLSATACMDASLAAAQAHAALGAIARIEPEMGREAARLADTVPADQRGPFHGVPFLAKDLGAHARGLAPAAGNPVLRERYSDPSADDDLFARFRASGLLPFGLTTVPEFGLALTSEPPETVPACNPWNLSYSPGGSSGGAAATVAAGIVAIAHATDAAGSIRVPAACCGLIGLKPSRDRSPGGPSFLNHLMGIASQLVLARSVRDVATAFHAVKTCRGRSERPVKRIGLAISPRCSDATNAKTEQAAKLFSALGYQVTTISSLDGLGLEAHRLARLVFRVGLANWLGLESLGKGQVTPVAFAIAEEGRALAPTEIYTLSKDLARFTYQADQLFDDIDAILCPVPADGPPRIGALDPNQTDPEERFEQMEAIAPNVALANAGGLPAIAMPFGMMEDMPFGVQLFGPQGADEDLLAVAAAFQAAAPTLAFPHPIAGLS
ncbi:MAG: amidase [Hyphomicrobiales bacterium]